MDSFRLIGVSGDPNGPGSLRPVVTGFYSEPGLLRRVFVTAYNRTNFSWTSETDFGIFIATHWYSLPDNKLVMEVKNTPLPVVVAPGSTQLFPAIITVPERVGEYLLVFSLSPVNFYWPEANNVTTWKIKVVISPNPISPNSLRTYKRISSGIKSLTLGTL